MNIFGNDLAVSLVDDAFLFSTRAQATPFVLPAYVTKQTGSSRVLACGEEAKAMLGREPGSLSVARVMDAGVIADPDSAASLFRFGLRAMLGKFRVARPRVLIACRNHDSGKSLVKSMAVSGGARKVYLIEMGMATAIGMQLDVQKPELQAVLSVSDDWFEFSVISLAGVLTGSNGAIGSRELVEDIQNHLALGRGFRPEFEVLASQVQSRGVEPRAAHNVPGWETWAGRTELGRLVSLETSGDVLAVGMMPSLVRMTERIKVAIRLLPSEKQYQLSRTTIHATGSAMNIPGLAQMMADQIGYPVTPFTPGIHPSINGCRIVLKELNLLRRMKDFGK